MATESPVNAPNKVLLWIGRVLSALVVLSLIFSAIMKVVQPGDFAKEFNKLGWDVELAVTVAILELTCALIYAFPYTAVLGAILITGYMGGAVATHVRIYDNFIPPVIMGVMAWLGLLLRDRRLWSLLPIRRL